MEKNEVLSMFVRKHNNACWLTEHLTLDDSILMMRDERGNNARFSVRNAFL